MKKDSGYNTRQKENLLTYLINNKNKHTNVQEISAFLSSEGTPVGVATIYRQLDRLVEQGLVRKYAFDGKTSACYQYIEDEEQCREDLGVIIREADRLSAMVNEILEYSEMQSAEYKPESEPVDLSAAAERVCASFESLYSREGGRIEKDIEKGIIVRGNSGKLERAIYNLLDNAVRHNGESKLINVSLSAENNKAKLCITDHGDGIPPEELENIWDRYYTYRQREKKGVSGLGLAIVQQTARSHGGSCYAESTIGKGSSFIILLDTI